MKPQRGVRFYPKVPPRCFSADYYNIAPVGESMQCIAPTDKGTRCRLDISTYENEEACRLAFAIHAATNAIGSCTSQHIREMSLRLVLFMLCGDVHREKVVAERACLMKVAEQYRAVIQFGPIPDVKETRRSSRFSVYAQPPLLDANGKPRTRWLLKPSDMNRSCLSILPVFTRYRGVTFSFRELFLSPVLDEKAFVDAGVVYAFEWPAHPGLLKIGSTAYTAKHRMEQEWLNCHPGSEVFCEIQVPFPRRIEELIHVEIAVLRRKLVCCSDARCKKTHTEWFKTTKEHIMELMKAWVAICDVAAPYKRSGRNLTASWVERIEINDGYLTTRRLLKILRQERPDAGRPTLRNIAPTQGDLARQESEDLSPLGELNTFLRLVES